MRIERNELDTYCNKMIRPIKSSCYTPKAMLYSICTSIIRCLCHRYGTSIKELFKPDLLFYSNKNCPGSLSLALVKNTSAVTLLKRSMEASERSNIIVKSALTHLSLATRMRHQVFIDSNKAQGAMVLYMQV